MKVEREESSWITVYMKPEEFAKALCLPSDGKLINVYVTYNQVKIVMVEK